MLQDAHLSFSKLTTKLQQSRQCAICIRPDVQVNGIEQRMQINRCIYLWSIDFNQDAYLIKWRNNSEKIILRQLNIHMQKNEVGLPVPNTLYKN